MNYERALRDYCVQMRAPGAVTCFTIANTAKPIERYYFTPHRVHDNLAVCGVVVASTAEARAFAACADGQFDYIAADSEKKINPARYAGPSDVGNIKGVVQDVVRTSRFLTFKANDVTVNAIDIFVSDRIADITEQKIAIVGAGNIGFKLALRLVERGCWVNLYRRDGAVLRTQVDAINATKSPGTIACAIACSSLASCLVGAHVVIAAADAPHCIALGDLAETMHDVLLIDCGKACYADDVSAAHAVYRTDVGMALLYQLKMVIASHEVLHPRFGKQTAGGTTYVCGVVGRAGDVVVADLNDRMSVVGVCDGKGGLLPP